MNGESDEQDCRRIRRRTAKAAIEPEAGSEAQATYAAPAAPMPDFAPEAAHDLGLITDFGNAAIDALLPADGGIEPTPLETVGGEVAEEEQRYRRAAAHALQNSGSRQAPPGDADSGGQGRTRQ